MDDYALVLNAGSSSLKFCVFQRPAGESWRLEARGQIEGIGTSPRLSVKDANGESLAKQDVAVRDGREALDALAGWLRSKYGGSRVLGRWPSRGPWRLAFQRPDDIERGCARESCTSWYHSRHFINLTISRPSKQFSNDYREYRKLLVSIPVFIVDNRRLPNLFRFRANSAKQGLQRYGFHGLSYEYIASVLPQVAPEIAEGESSSLISEVARVCVR